MVAIPWGVSLRRYVLTGAPGAGKTSVLRALQEQGFAVAGEAATEVIGREQRKGVAEPWRYPTFIDQIAGLQRQWRQQPVAAGAPAQVCDRSPLCTLALARYLGHPVTSLLADEVQRMLREHTFQRQVFLLDPLGFIQPTAARRISYPDAVEFGTLHEQVYNEHGFDVVHVPAGTVTNRAAIITRLIAAQL